MENRLASYLQSHFGIDSYRVFSRDLGVGSDDFHLELVDAPKDIYTLDALDAAGKVVQHATFSPKTVGMTLTRRSNSRPPSSRNMNRPSWGRRRSAMLR